MWELRDQVIIDSVLHWAQDDHRPGIVNWRGRAQDSEERPHRAACPTSEYRHSVATTQMR